MPKNIHGQEVNVNIREEIKKAQKKGAKLSEFAVGFAKEHEIYINQVTWYQVKNGTRESKLQRENEELKSEIAKLQKKSA